jgi:hypothetical protein
MALETDIGQLRELVAEKKMEAGQSAGREQTQDVLKHSGQTGGPCMRRACSRGQGIIRRACDCKPMGMMPQVVLSCSNQVTLSDVCDHYLLPLFPPCSLLSSCLRA